jgi:hypothetical protein
MVRRTYLDSYYFVTLFDFLSLKNNVNVPSESNKQKRLCQKSKLKKKKFKNYFFAGILKVKDESSRIRIQDLDPDPH